MSDDQTEDATSASKGGGRMKWLLGAAAAVVLLGGGYFAWQNYAGAQDSAQTAYNDAYSAEPEAPEPLRDRTFEPGAETVVEDATADESAALPAVTESRATPQRRRARPAPVEVIPEETIGVASVAETNVQDDIVVMAPRRPVWVQAPSARRLSALYPERALVRGREGEARLRCTVLTGGALDCTRVDETPGGGFGMAALRVARAYRHAPQRADGADAAGTPLNLRVVFRIADEERGRGRAQGALAPPALPPRPSSPQPPASLRFAHG